MFLLLGYKTVICFEVSPDWLEEKQVSLYQLDMFKNLVKGSFRLKFDLILTSNDLIQSNVISYFRSEFKIGQHFIHSTLNYRGVVLFPVNEDIYIYNEKTRDYFPKKSLDCYHVLVDKRDLNETPNAIYKELIFTDRKL